jgi:hypothetical protein
MPLNLTPEEKLEYLTDFVESFNLKFSINRTNNRLNCKSVAMLILQYYTDEYDIDDICGEVEEVLCRVQDAVFAGDVNFPLSYTKKALQNYFDERIALEVEKC